MSEDPGELLKRIRDHAVEHLSHLPNYTCHETIDRSIRAGSAWHPLDRVELEAVFTGHEVLFSRPGSDRFGEQSVERIASGGTMGDGMLGSQIDLLLTKNGAEFQFAGTGKKDGHKTFRYNLRVPIEKSGYLIRHDGAEGIAGYEGSVWVDADSLDLVRVDFKVNRIPSHLGVRLVEESLHYKRLIIGNSEFNLPDHSELGALADSGAYSLNIVKLNRCREYSADSVVKYSSPSQGTAARERQDIK
jgi:hypothetical protein